MHRGWPAVAGGVRSGDRSGPHELGHAERKVERLAPVEARVAHGLVAVVEMFVEDLVRNVALKLNAHPDVSWYKVEAENYESIHNHNAYACIEKA